jgi:hypothetical protein
MSAADRAFNVATLGLTLLGGLSAVLEWFQVLDACSGAERRQPGMYSCPSEARTFGTWAVGGAIVLLGLASRYLLWKRLRALYVPLLALQLGAAGVVVWLATHHPDWGPR